jgi:4-amino-4-deoxy-L-arabinose transferase-like glycosyltransferase
MPKRKPKVTPPPSLWTSGAWDSEVRLLAWLATCVSVLSVLYYFQRNEVTLYGDAVAHMNIARRIFDSKTPGLLQLGTVWLPLPHLLMVPFLLSTEMWHRGIGGSIPSLIAYVFATIGIFRLIRGTLARPAAPGSTEPDAAARFAAWTAALIFAANPNLIYMQTTAMGESLYLAFFIWSIVYFGEAIRGEARQHSAKALTKCGLCLAAACLTRYDGWFLAVAMAAAAVFYRLVARNPASSNTFSRGALVKFVLIAAAAPALWFAYNAAIYKNPLEFENGPYSAKAIEKKTQSAGNPGHPGSGNLAVATLFLTKAAEINVAENPWIQRFWVMLVFAAIAVAFIKKSSELKTWPLLFLLIPVPFYALSIAYGGVPIFVPTWWPFSHYNVRYGLQLLPAFAAAMAVLVCFIFRANYAWRLRAAAILALFVFVITSYASVWIAGPVCLKEAQINMRTRIQLEAQLAPWLRKLPANSTLLMYLGDHVGAVQQAGVPIKRIINEGNHRVWRQPDDADGLWERALADPPKYADYVVAFEGDRVWQAIEGRHLHLEELLEVHVTGQPRAILYRAR